MNDDRQHEYVPPVARDILDGQRIAAVAAYAEARAEANNLTEALRVVNARLVEVTAERDKWHEATLDMQLNRDALRDVVRGLSDRDTLRERVAELEAERDDLLALLREAYLHAGRWDSDPEGEFQAWIAEAKDMRSAPRPAWER